MPIIESTEWDYYKLKYTFVCVLKCDHCGSVIATASSLNDWYEARDDLPIDKHRGLNWDYECNECRSARDRTYDAWVLNPMR